jgi:hypothetical protein
MVSELESPLLVQAAEETKVWLNENPIPRLLRRPMVVDRSLMPSFRSPEFEHQKTIIANLLQTMAVTRPQFLDGKAGDWVRTAAYLIEAARFAQGHGNNARAAELLEQARSIAGFLVGDADGRRLTLNGNDPAQYELAFEPGVLTSDTYDSASREAILQAGLNALSNEIRPGMAQALNPNKEFAAPEQVKAIAASMPRTPEIEPYLRALDSLTETAIRFKDSQSGRALRASLLPTLDFTVGLFPVVAVARDMTEFVTGRNFWTLQPLTMTERGIALAGVMTAGMVSTGYKVLAGVEQVVEIEQEVAPAVRVAKEVQDTAEALRGVGADASHYVKTLKENVQSARSAEEQISVLKTSLDEARVAIEQGKPFGRSKIGKTYYGNHELGPIKEMKDVSSFSGAKYTAIKPQAGEMFFCVQSEFGAYWSRIKPSSQIQLMSEGAVHPYWNRFENIFELTIPEGMNLEFYEGTAANQSGSQLIRGVDDRFLETYHLEPLTSPNNGSLLRPAPYDSNFGSAELGPEIRDGSFFHGGGNQVFIPRELRDSLMPYIRKEPFK